MRIDVRIYDNASTNASNDAVKVKFLPHEGRLEEEGWQQRLERNYRIGASNNPWRTRADIVSGVDVGVVEEGGFLCANEICQRRRENIIQRPYRQLFQEERKTWRKRIGLNGGCEQGEMVDRLRSRRLTEFSVGNR